MHAVLTSARGDAQRVVTINELAQKGGGPMATLCVNPLEERQTVLGIGTSLTQASAVALSTLTAERRRDVLEMVFGPRGAAFSMIRTHIGSCDFNTSSDCYAPEPSLRNMALYFLNVLVWTDEEDLPLFWFSAFDEDWKVGPEGECGAFWGLWDAKGELKV